MAALVVVSLAGCGDAAKVTFPVGPLAVSVSTAELALPTELRDGDVILELPCGPMGMCPTSEALTVSCEAGVCDPAPTTIVVPLSVVDVDTYIPDDFRALLNHIESFEVLDVTYAIELNTLNIRLPQIEVFWGPEGATTVDPAMGVVRFGSVPATRPGQTGSGMMSVDAAGAAALSDHLVDVSKRVRFFARTQVDLAPGDPFPEGRLDLNVSLRVRAVGSLL